MKQNLLYVSEPNGKVTAVIVAMEDWIALLERICDLQEKLRPKNPLDRKLAALVRKRVGNKKNVDLDDIGFIGTGRSMTKEESMLISVHIQAMKAKRTSPKRGGAVVLG